MAPSSASCSAGEKSIYPSNPVYPKNPGIWWNVQGVGLCKWKALPEADAESIISALWMGESHVNVNFVENESPDGVTGLYKVNLDDMTAARENLSEGAKLNIRIVQGLITEINSTDCYNNLTEIGVWWGPEDEPSWNKYSEQQEYKILRALRRKHHYAVLDGEPCGGPERYLVDLKNMNEIDVQTGDQQDVQIVGNVVDWNESSPPKKKTKLQEPLHIPRIPTTSFLVRAVLDKLVTHHAIEKLLKSKISSFHVVKSLVVSEYLQKGQCWDMYDNFRICFEQSVRKVPGYRGQLLRILNDLASSNLPQELYDGERSTIVKHVFHGTPMKNFKPIQEKGMDPSRRSTIGGDWFGLNSEASSTYSTSTKNCAECPGGVVCDRMLVFLVIMPTEVDCNEVNIIAVKNTKHQLPLAEIHLVRKEIGQVKT